MASTIFRQADFPRYLPGIATTAAAQVNRRSFSRVESNTDSGSQGLSIIILVVSNEIFKRENAKADRGETVLEGLESFRYTL